MTWIAGNLTWIASNLTWIAGNLTWIAGNLTPKVAYLVIANCKPIQKYSTDRFTFKCCLLLTTKD
ncbi:MAG: hypothetical protein LBC20_01565 [Planctomycetaceae bacterium]|nr:hypothetical protein [Planctomycetaceae bacterium]